MIDTRKNPALPGVLLDKQVTRNPVDITIKKRVCLEHAKFNLPLICVAEEINYPVHSVLLPLP
jgi:hypothetical protein